MDIVSCPTACCPSTFSSWLDAIHLNQQDSRPIETALPHTQLVLHLRDNLVLGPIMHIRRPSPIVQPHLCTRNPQRLPEARQEAADFLVDCCRVDVSSTAGGAKFNADVHEERINRVVIAVSLS